MKWEYFLIEFYNLEQLVKTLNWFGFVTENIIFSLIIINVLLWFMGILMTSFYFKFSIFLQILKSLEKCLVN